MEQQTPPFWSLTAAQVQGRLETVPEGLSAVEAASRLKLYAGRRLTPENRANTLTLLLGQFSSPIVLLLLGATAFSLFLHDTTDAVIILAIVLASGLLGFWQERGAAGAVEKLLSLVEVSSGVRSRHSFFRSRPGTRLMLATLGVVAATLVLPVLPVAPFLGLTPLPLSSLALLALIVAMYICSAELLKRLFYRHFEPSRRRFALQP